VFAVCNGASSIRLGTFLGRLPSNFLLDMLLTAEDLGHKLSLLVPMTVAANHN
jgi:hypothetical protein